MPKFGDIRDRHTELSSHVSRKPHGAHAGLPLAPTRLFAIYIVRLRHFYTTLFSNMSTNGVFAKHDRQLHIGLEDHQCLFQALAAVTQLHPKQRQLLHYLNSQRSPHQPDHTIPLSYTQIRNATGVTTDHIRRNGLHRLFSSGLLSVIQKGLIGTVYRLHYSEALLRQILDRTTLPGPSLDEDAASATQPVSPVDLGTSAFEKKLAHIHELHHSQQILLRDLFEATLRDDQRRWLADQAKTIVDQREGTRFIQDRFPYYETERARLLDEWRARQQYGEQVPALIAHSD